MNWGFSTFYDLIITTVWAATFCFVYTFTCWWTLGLFTPFDYYKECCYKHLNTRFCVNIGFHSYHMVMAMVSWMAFLISLGLGFLISKVVVRTV